MKIQGKNLFPLSLLNTNLKDGYYMDAAGSVFSTRGRGGLTRLSGSHTNSGRYFSFQTKMYGRACTYRADELRQRVLSHKDFHAHTKEEITMEKLGVDVTKLKAKSQGARNHAATVDAGIEQRGSVIGRVHKGHLVFGSEPKIHTSEQSVKDEMQRLALQYPGVKFVELKITKSVVAGGVTWA